MTWSVVWAHLSDGPSLPGTVCFSACRHYYNWNLNDRKLVIRIYYHMATKVTSRHFRFELKQTKRPRYNLSGSLHKGYSQHLQYLGWAVLRIAFVLRSTEVTPGSFGLFQFKSKMPAGSFSWHVVINSNYQFAAVQIPIATVPARIPRTCRPQFEYITTCQLKYTGGILIWIETNQLWTACSGQCVSVCCSACRHHHNWNLNGRKLVIRICYHMPTKVPSRHFWYELKQTKRSRCNLSGS